jgi:hypothetical protein
MLDLYETCCSDPHPDMIAAAKIDAYSLRLRFFMLSTPSNRYIFHLQFVVALSG